MSVAPSMRNVPLGQLRGVFVYTLPVWVVAAIVILVREVVGFDTLSGPLYTVFAGIYGAIMWSLGWLPILGPRTWAIIVVGAGGLIALEASVRRYQRSAEAQDLNVDWDSKTNARAASALLAVLVVIGLIQVYRSDVSLSWALAWQALPYLGIVLAGYVIYRVRQSQRKYSKSDVAVRRAGTTIQRDIDRWSAYLFGVVVLGISVAVGLFTGAMSALGDLGDPLMQFAPEGAYLAVTAMGYVQLGGEFLGSWIIPEVSAAQFVGIALGMAILAVMIANR